MHNHEFIQAIDLALVLNTIEIEKDLDPLNRRDFVTLVQRFGARLRGQARPHEIEAVDAALGAMDVDWPNLTNRQRDAAVKAANTAIAGLSRVVPPLVEGTVISESTRFVAGVKRSIVRTHKLKIGTSFTAKDRETARRVARNQGNFVTDFYGNRARAVEGSARSVVAHGLEHGLGVDEIAGRLEKTVKAEVLGRSPSYWNVVANSFMNRARTDTNLKGFREAGIERWMFEAVMDEQTTDQCRMLHEKTFSTGAAIDRIRATDEAADPVRELKKFEPWLQNGKDDEGRAILYTRDPDTKERTVIARVLESGRGESDRVGRYEQLVNDQTMEKMGIPWPPLHGRCRSTIVPAD
jgi:SPP1 gp7 family putative phage head morphogenesis protein